MKPLVWKKEMPGGPGWWWLRKWDHIAKRVLTGVVELRLIGTKLAIGNSTLEDWTDMEKAEWAGPIPQPGRAGTETGGSMSKELTVGSGVHNTIHKRSLVKTYGQHVFRVLSSLLDPIAGKKGWYVARTTLPTVEAYKQMEKNAFTFNIEDLVSGAKSELESLKDELQDWYDNLPESFQNGDKGDQLQNAISKLESVCDNSTLDEVPACLADVRVFATPLVGGRRGPSRADRGSQAAYELRQVAEAVAEWSNKEEEKTEDGPTPEQDEAKEFGEACEEAADNADNVEYPGMY